MKNLAVIAHNIRSLHNVGSIFRTAEGAGVDKIFLTGYTGRPPRKEIAKVALGSEDRVPWEYTKDVGRLIGRLKGKGFQVVTLEQGRTAVDYKKYKPRGKIALIIGNEVRGVSKKLQELSDIVIEIPMLGDRRSLNVSVAFGIVAFHLANFLKKV
ncbi:RNA methyltransferase [Candidatus Microgenomates bacterium]|nr:RNA methyltransferase [Candidatus Microgenomates bacterium]